MATIDLPNRPTPLPQESVPPNDAAYFRQRRRTLRRWFIVSEAVSLAVLIGSILAGISERFTAEWLTPLFRILPIAAALVAGLLPILFFSNPTRRMR